MSQAFPLATLASLPEPVLSVYLDTNPLRRLNRNFDHGSLGWFSRNAKRLLTTAENSEHHHLAVAIRQVEHFLEQNLPEEQGIALFAGPGLWEVFHLPSEPENELHWGKPMVWQLTAMTHRHRPWCVVTVDRSGARLFAFQYGELLPIHTLEFHFDPSHWKRMQAFHTGERQAGMPHGPQRDLFERRRDANFLRFLSDAAQRVARECESRGLKQVLLLGRSRYTGWVEHELPAMLKKHTVQIPHFWHGWNSSSPSASVLKEALWRFESDSQAQQVGELLGGGQAVVTGLRQTLTMLQRGKLGMLVAEEGFNPDLGYCTTCDYTSSSSICPRCQGALENRTLHQMLPQLLVRHVCESEFLSGEPAQRIRGLGSIGGWLRQKHPINAADALLQRQSAAWLGTSTA